MKYTILSIIVVLSLISATGLSARLNSRQKQLMKEEVAEKLQVANVPIAFYGQVIDQANASVSNLKVAIGMFSWVDPSGKGNDYDQQIDDFTVVTDAQGRFEFHSKKGTGLEVGLQPDVRYHYSVAAKRMYSYDPTEQSPVYHPDAKTPVVFHVWRKQGGESVVDWGPGIEMKQDGTLIAADLLAHEFRSPNNATADFRVSLTADIPPGSTASYKCRWSVRLEAVDGGVALTDDEFMYLAPASGYQPAIEITYDPASPDWIDNKTLKFYLRSRGGKHCARVILDIAPRPGRPTGIMSFVSVINLSGSRNLEEGEVIPYLTNSQ